MHVQTHILSGWCIGNLLPLRPRERAFCMVAASVADLDGLVILRSYDAYLRWHHTLGHNLPFGLVSSAVLAAASPRKIGPFFLYLALFHLHLVMDFFGSGPGWPIHYLWPMQLLWLQAQWIWLNPNAWEFYSWQNMLAELLFVIWTVVIATRWRRTPLENGMPSLDRELVARLGREHRRTPPIVGATVASSNGSISGQASSSPDDME